MKTWKSKIKIIAVLVVSFVVFAMTFFAMAENKNGNSLFLDSDQDGLTDQEEQMIGTDPYKADTDGDGYSDGKEVESGYNPLKPAPGDKIIIENQSSASPNDTQNNNTEKKSSPETSEKDTNSPNINSINQLLGVPDNLLDENSEFLSDFSSDPENPNLTNEMIAQLLEITKNKAENSEDFINNPTYTTEDFSQVTQKALQSIDIEKNFPTISDDELNILPPIDSKKISNDELKAKQKKEIEKYLAQVAFVLASNSPFTIEKTSDLETNINSESAKFLSALEIGDASKLNSYAAKAQTSIDQLKKVEIPYILKDFHKSILQLAIYTLNLKDDILFNTTDPMKSLAAASNLQAIAQSAIKLQNEFSQILANYGIEAIPFP